MKQGWEVKKLREVCDFYNGQAHENHIEDDGNFTVVNSKFIASDGKIYKKTNTPLSLLFNNDITMVMSDVPNGKTIAKCFLIEKDRTYTLNQRICVIRSNNFNIKFLYYQLNRNKYFLSFDNGENQTNLRKNDILNCPLFIPPLEEQQRIVTILDEAFEAIAKAKENAEKNLLNARELFETYLNSVFSNPKEDWEEKTLNQISENLDNKRIPITKNVRKSGVYPYYGASGIVDYVNDYIFDEDLLLISEDGANLLARSSPIAFSVSGKFWVNNHAHILKFKNMETQKFVEQFFASIKLDEYITGAAQPKLNQAALNSIVIPIPPLEEQHKIVTKLDELSLETKKLEKIYEQKIVDLEELKKSILQKAFNGELT
jgi:type I restriction enzyme S subunit